MKSLTIVFVLAAIAAALAPIRSTSATTTLNCASFPTQAEAQAFLRANPADPYGLDADFDGVACEGNPCPCETFPVARPGTVVFGPNPFFGFNPGFGFSPGFGFNPFFGFNPVFGVNQGLGVTHLVGFPGLFLPPLVAAQPSTPAPQSQVAAAVSSQAPLRQVVVPLDVYNAVVAEYNRGGDAVALLQSMSGGFVISPPSTGDGGLR